MDDAVIVGLVAGGSAVAGSLVSVVGQPLAAWLERRHARSLDREDVQLLVARDLLRLLEKFFHECDLEISADRRGVPSSRDHLIAQIHECDARALELSDARVRALLEQLSKAYWYIAQPGGPIEPEPAPNSYVVRNAARSVLGAVLRGEQPPGALPAEALAQIKAAAAVDAWLDEQSEAYEKHGR